MQGALGMGCTHDLLRPGYDTTSTFMNDTMNTNEKPEGVRFESPTNSEEKREYDEHDDDIRSLPLIGTSAGARQYQAESEPFNGNDRQIRHQSSMHSLASLMHVNFGMHRGRYSGLLAILLMSNVIGMNLTWFGPIATSTAEIFGFSLDQVSWLENIVICTFIAVAPIVPIVYSRIGVRNCYYIATFFLLLSGWVRQAGTSSSLDSRSAYALLMIGQALSGIPQVTFQVLAPKFSEMWFDEKSRTTATMALSIAFPVGNAIGQLLSPHVKDVRKSILVLAIICSAVSPFILFVGTKPPIPPSHAGHRPSPSYLITIRAIVGLHPLSICSECKRRQREDVEKRYLSQEHITDQMADIESRLTSMPRAHTWDVTRAGTSTEESKRNSMSKGGRPSDVTYVDAKRSSFTNDSRRGSFMKGKSAVGSTENAFSTARPSNVSQLERPILSPRSPLRDQSYMTVRERVDFLILAVVFGVLASGLNTFSLLSGQILIPYGYSESTAGLMGAAMLLSGVVAAFTVAPLLDKRLTTHLGLAARIFSPVLAAVWLSLIWAVRANNAVALFILFGVLGACLLSMLPIALELGAELTRNAGASSAILWFSGNAFSILFILVLSALRAPVTATPPTNMHRALIFNGAFICAVTSLIFVFRGHQKRREQDVRVAQAVSRAHSIDVERST